MSEPQHYYNISLPRLRQFQVASVEAMKRDGACRPIVLRICSLDGYCGEEMSLGFVPASCDVGFTLLCLLERSWHENKAKHCELVFACLFPGFESSYALFQELFGRPVIGTFTLIVDSREPNQSDRVEWQELSPFLFTLRCYMHFGDDDQQ